MNSTISFPETPLRGPVVPVSWGELLDKVSILEIKVARIEEPSAGINVRMELTILSEAVAALFDHPRLAEWRQALTEVNEALWRIEDRIREKEAQKCFDHEFIQLARSIYQANDRRAFIKRDINLTVGSQLIEEKGYRR
jgi:Family of unknown function (DUF6165)